MNINEFNESTKVKTTKSLLGFDAGTVGMVKVENGSPALGASGETVMVSFPGGAGLYYLPADLEEV